MRLWGRGPEQSPAVLVVQRVSAVSCEPPTTLRRNKPVIKTEDQPDNILLGDVPDLKEAIMVGGFFDGDEKSLATLAERVEFEIEHNVSEYSTETINNFKLTVALLRCVSDMVKRVDYLLNGDEDEDTFLSLWSDRFGVDDSEDAEDAEGEEDEQTDA